METVIYVAVALVAGVVVGKYLLGGDSARLRDIAASGGHHSARRHLRLRNRRETIRWTMLNGSVTSVTITPIGGRNPYPNAAASGGAGLSGALSSAVSPGESYPYLLGATGGTSNLNGRIIIQR